MNLHLKKSQVKRLEKPFHNIDSNGDGKLSLPEMTQFMRENDLDYALAPAIFAIFDVNGDGVLSFEEFTSFVEACGKTASVPRHIYRLLFQALDKDRDSLIAPPDIKFFGECCKVEMTEDEIVAELERTHPGKRLGSFEEVCMMFNI